VQLSGSERPRHGDDLSSNIKMPSLHRFHVKKMKQSTERKIQDPATQTFWTFVVLSLLSITKLSKVVTLWDGFEKVKLVNG
jgi:hypothetical protein